MRLQANAGSAMRVKLSPQGGGWHSDGRLVRYSIQKRWRLCSHLFLFFASLMPDLKPHRVHEAYGPGRHVFALFQAARAWGEVVWVRPARAVGQLLPAGLPAGLAARLLLVVPRNEVDLLWSVEEALRSGVGMVIAEPEKPLSLTAGRRLQLAAEAGGATGLMLIRDGAGSPAAETRWKCRLEGGDSTRHYWGLNKNKSGTLGAWIVSWNGASAAFDLVSATGQQSGPEETSS